MVRKCVSSFSGCFGPTSRPDKFELPILVRIKINGPIQMVILIDVSVTKHFSKLPSLHRLVLGSGGRSMY